MNLSQYCIIPDWPAPQNVRALQTTRNGGLSVAPYTSLNLGTHVGDAPLTVARNRMLLNTVLPSEPVWLEQVHGTVVANACPEPSRRADAASCVPLADACIARNRGAVCVVMTADCLPILLCDTQGKVVAAVHAGWRGLAAGVIEATVSAMQTQPANQGLVGASLACEAAHEVFVGASLARESAHQPAQFMAWLGPAISQNAFEVGAEVRDCFVAQTPAAAAAFTPSPARGDVRGEGQGESVKFHADLYALARLRLNALGITQIYGGDRCTYTESDTFFSYRRDGVTGRMATFIWLD
jgi:copper oxidase (laccase) domain-containing protein